MRLPSSPANSMSNPTGLVRKPWTNCNILRDDGRFFAVPAVLRQLSVVEHLESVLPANLQRGTRLRQSILQKAFTRPL